MNQRDEPSAQRGQASHGGQVARNREHLRGVAHLEHATDRQSVRFSLGTHEQIAFHQGLCPRRINSAAMRSAI